MEYNQEKTPKEKRVSFRPRLYAAAELLKGFDTVADIGADHGRLSVGLLQRGYAKHVIATEISAPSLEKAKSLASFVGVAGSMEFRVGDGLAPLKIGEADALALCGMGGALMAEILSLALVPLCGAKRVVMQPMRGVEELRRYLLENNFKIVADTVAPDAGRYYQIFAAEPGKEEPPLPGWPKDFFALGVGAAGHPLFLPMAKTLYHQCEKRLIEAEGTRGEIVLQEKKEKLFMAMTFAGERA